MNEPTTRQAEILEDRTFGSLASGPPDDLPADSLPPLLREISNELRSRREIGPEFNLLKFHLNSPKISFLSYPDSSKDPHSELNASVVVDLVTSKVRRDEVYCPNSP